MENDNKSKLTVSASDYAGGDIAKGIYDDHLVKDSLNKAEFSEKSTPKEVEEKKPLPPTVEEAHADEAKAIELKKEASAKMDKKYSYDTLSSDEKRAMRILLNIEAKSPKEKIEATMEHFGVSKMGAINMLADATKHIKEDIPEEGKEKDGEKGTIDQADATKKMDKQRDPDGIEKKNDMKKSLQDTFDTLEGGLSSSDMIQKSIDNTLEKAKALAPGGRWITIDGRHVHVGAGGEVDAGKIYGKDEKGSKKKWSKGDEIGKTKSGKSVYEDMSHSGHKDFTEQDHEDARRVHMNEEVTGRTNSRRDEAEADHGRAANKAQAREASKKDQGKGKESKSTGVAHVDEALKNHGFDTSYDHNSDTRKLAVTYLKREKEKLDKKVDKLAESAAGGKNKVELDKHAKALGVLKDNISKHEKTIGADKKGSEKKGSKNQPSLKHFIGDEGMFRGGEFKVVSHQSYPNRYTIQELDENGKAKGGTDTINQKDFESSFSKFPKSEGSASKKESGTPTMDTFKDIAKNSKDVTDFMSKVREVKNVPSSVATEFQEKYGGGQQTLEGASKKFMDEHGKSTPKKKSFKGYDVLKNPPMVGDSLSMRTDHGGGRTSGVDGSVYEVSPSGKTFRLEDDYGNKDEKWRNIVDYKKAKISRKGDKISKSQFNDIFDNLGS